MLRLSVIPRLNVNTHHLRPSCKYVQSLSILQFHVKNYNSVIWWRLLTHKAIHKADRSLSDQITKSFIFVVHSPNVKFSDNFQQEIQTFRSEHAKDRCNCKTLTELTWKGESPGGTQVYSSRAHPLSSSEVEWYLCPECIPGLLRLASVGSSIIWLRPLLLDSLLPLKR